MRETALESSAVLNLLEDQFVSTWSLLVDLKECIENAALSEEDKALCKAGHDAYSFPVTSMVLTSGGQVLATMNANDLMELSNKHWEDNDNLVYTCPISMEYEKFLTAAIKP